MINKNDFNKFTKEELIAGICSSSRADMILLRCQSIREQNDYKKEIAKIDKEQVDLEKATRDYQEATEKVKGKKMSEWTSEELNNLIKTRDEFYKQLKR